MKKKLIALAGVTVALAASVMTATPALASTDGTCANLKVCVYNGTNYGGSQYSADGYATTTQLPSGQVNQVSSWKNRTNATPFDLWDAADPFKADTLLSTLSYNKNKADLGTKSDAADFVRKN